MKRMAIPHTLFKNKNLLTYTSCYCEENVWKLCEKLAKGEEKSTNDSNTYAVFISNEEERVPYWCQQSQPQSVCLWDYHVIFIEQQPQASVVYDLDTILPFPSNFETYTCYSFLQTYLLKDMIKDKERAQEVSTFYLQYFDTVRFRVIPSQVFYNGFSSDRSHMIDPETKEYRNTPPDYPCIQMNENEPMNLFKYRNMKENLDDQMYGKVMDLEQFCHMFGVKDFKAMKNQFLSNATLI